LKRIVTTTRERFEQRIDEATNEQNHIGTIPHELDLLLESFHELAVVTASRANHLDRHRTTVAVALYMQNTSQFNVNQPRDQARGSKPDVAKITYLEYCAVGRFFVVADLFCDNNVARIDFRARELLHTDV
jgi:hypothetical protein